MLDEKLYKAPVPIAENGDNQALILDIGTGTGIWAIEMAEMFPKALVIGTDLSPVQPSNRQWIPPNCRFEVDDAEREWIFERVSVPPRPLAVCVAVAGLTA